MSKTRLEGRIARDIFLRRFRLERSYRPPALLRHPEWNVSAPLDLVVAARLLALAGAGREMAFLQVGGFDGGPGDPIHPLVERHHLRGVIVEPQGAAFEALRARYAPHPMVKLVNAAIDRQDGHRDFYSTARESQKASFNRAHLLKNGIGPEQIVTHVVRTVTIATLLAEVELPRVDLIQIDTEGYDFEVIKAIDVANRRPAIIRFEQEHLSEADCDECVAMLASHGYRFISERRDLIAVLEE